MNHSRPLLHVPAPLHQADRQSLCSRDIALLSSLHSLLLPATFPCGFPSAPQAKAAKEDVHIFSCCCFPQLKASSEEVVTLRISFSSSMVCLLATSSWTVWPQFLTTDSMTCKGKGQ